MSAFERICPVHNVDDLVCGEAVRLEEELLREDLAAAEERVKELEFSLRLSENQKTKLEAENVRLRSALDKFDRHLIECKWGQSGFYKSADCTCGFTQTLSLLAQENAELT